LILHQLQMNPNEFLSIIIISILIIIRLVVGLFIGDESMQRKPTVGGGKNNARPHHTYGYPIKQKGVMKYNLSPEDEKIMMQTVTARNAPPQITYDDLKGRQQYVSDWGIKPGIHIGQRKLHLSEIEYLTNVLPADRTQMQYVVYAGAAPSNHTNYLAGLFPHLKFILVDPARFDIMEDGRSHFETMPDHIKYLKRSFGAVTPADNIDRSKYLEYIRGAKDVTIFLIEDYFTDDLATLFAPLNAHFVSDIRTWSHGQEGTPSDLDVVWNLAMQYNWVRHMNPLTAMLKFRAPFYDDATITPTENERPAFDEAKRFGIDFVADYNKKQFTYFGGIVYLQAWPAKSSSETRLVVSRPFNLKTYDYHEYEDKLFYYNTYDRGFKHHANPYATQAIGFDHCNDCAHEAVIWDNYKNKFDSTFDVLSAVNYTSKLLKRNLFRGVHGHLYNPDMNYVRQTIERLKKME